MLTIEECQREVTGKQEGLFSVFCFHAKASDEGGVGGKGGDGGVNVLRRGSLGHGDQFSTIVRIHRVIHYICNCVIVSGHFMQRHKVSKLQGSDFLDAAELRKQILKGYLNLYIHAVGSLHCVLRSCFAQKMENFLGGGLFCSGTLCFHAQSITANLHLSGYELHKKISQKKTETCFLTCMHPEETNTVE